MNLGNKPNPFGWEAFYGCILSKNNLHINPEHKIDIGLFFGQVLFGGTTAYQELL